MTDMLAPTPPPPLAAPPARAHLRTGRARAAMKGSLWSLANILIATLISAAVFLTASRFLAPADFGVVALAATIVMFISCAIPIAFGDALVQRVDLRDDHLDTVFWACLGFGVLLYAGLLLSADALAAWADTPALAGLLPVIGLRLILESLTVVPTALVTRAVQFRIIALRTTLANVLGGGVCIAMVLAGSGYWALAISQVLSAIIAVIVMLPAAGWRPGFALRRRAAADLWRFGIFSAGNRLLNEMRLDQMLIGLLGGPVMLGLFFFARRLFQMLSDLTVGVFSPVSGVLLASMQGEPDKCRQAFLIASYAATGVALPVFTGLLVLAPGAVPLVFGAQWAGAVSAVQGFAVIGMMAGLGIVQAALIRSQGRADWWFWYQAVVQLSALPLIAMLYQQGLGVVMTALALRTVVLWPWTIGMTLRLLDMTLPAYVNSLRGPIGASAVMALAMIGLAQGLQAQTAPVAVLGLQVLVGILAYILIGAALSWQQARGVWRILRDRTAPA
jgi:O-antigen/teichoic acid export membrane protein